jgi:hypothetical protein
MVSRAPLAKLERWKASKGWDIPWYSSFGTDFNYDFGVTIDESVVPGEYNFRTRAESEAMGSDFFASDQPFEMPGRSCFLKPAAACSTPTPSTPAAWSPPAAPTTSSTSPRSAGKRSRRSPTGAATPPGLPRPTSRRDHPPRPPPLKELSLPMLPAGGALILAVASAMHHATANCVRGFPGSCDEPAAGLAGIG